MKTTIEKGLNIIRGDFTKTTNSNGQRTKAIIDKINSLMNTKLPKMIVPIACGYSSIMRHIEYDSENIFILNAPLNENGLGEETERTLIRVATDLGDTDIDKIIVFVFDTIDETYPHDYAENIVEAYGKECIVIEK